MKLFLAATCAALMICSAASAATVNATSITVGATTVTTASNNSNRADLGNALGAENGAQSGNIFSGFYSLGIGGSADFRFGTNFGGSGSVFEVTGGSRTGFVEAVRISALNVSTNSWDFIGRFTNGTGSVVTLAIPFQLLSGQVYSALRLTDDSANITGRDGFDVDSISVSAVPLPAAGFLLLAALAGLGAMRRRQIAIAA